MRVPFSGLYWANLSVGLGLIKAAFLLGLCLSFGMTVHATDVDCETRLGAGFAAVVEKALAQDVLTLAQVQALASANRPFNPLANAVPHSKNSAFIRFFGIQAQMSDETWAAERVKLQTFLDGATAQLELSNTASEMTRNIFNPWLYKKLSNPQIVQWIEYAGHAYIVAEVDGYVELSELGKPGALWKSAEPYDPELTYVWFHNSDGSCTLNYYRQAEKRGLERLKHFGKLRYEKTVIDLPSLAKTQGNLYVRDNWEIKELNPPPPYTGPRESAAGYPSNDWDPADKNYVYVNHFVEKPFKFTVKLPGKVFNDAEAFMTSDGRLLVAVGMTGARVLVYEPLKSQDPIFSYEFPEGPSKEKRAYARRFQFFERSGLIYLYSEFMGRIGGIDFFELNDNAGPLFSLNRDNDGARFKPIILKGADGQVFFIRKELREDHTVHIYSLFGNTGEKP